MGPRYRSIESLFHENFEASKTIWRDNKTNPYSIQAFWRDMFSLINGFYLSFYVWTLIKSNKRNLKHAQICFMQLSVKILHLKSLKWNLFIILTNWILQYLMNFTMQKVIQLAIKSLFPSYFSNLFMCGPFVLLTVKWWSFFSQRHPDTLTHEWF